MSQEQRTVEFDGFTWELRLPSNVDTELAEGRYWDKDVYEWCKTYALAGMICVDAGANIGVFSLLLSRCVGPQGWVYAFEPCQAFVGRLRRHVEINHIKNVSVVDQALGDRCGAALCHQDGPPYYSTARVEVQCNVPVPNGVQAVDMVTLDEFFAARKPPGFLKIDIDGNELQMLTGGRQIIDKYHPIMAIEIPLSDDGVEVAGWLSEHGYELSTWKSRVLSPGDCRATNVGGTVNVLALPLPTHWKTAR